MQDWQRILNEIPREKEKTKKVEKSPITQSKAKGQKRNRGRGAYSLQRPKLKVRSHPVVLDDNGPEVYNWRKSSMER